MPEYYSGNSVTVISVGVMNHGADSVSGVEATIDLPSGFTTAEPLTKTVDLSSGERKRLTWNITVPSAPPETAVFQVEVKGDAQLMHINATSRVW